MKRSPGGYRPKPNPKPPARCTFTGDSMGCVTGANAERAFAVHIKRERVRTSFDAVYPGMPPALRLSA